MTTRARSGLDALRREGRSFSALAALLLVVQLLLTGATGAAMAAERLSGADLTVLCHVAADGTSAATQQGPSEPERAPCPCLAGACTPMAGLPAAAAPFKGRIVFDSIAGPPSSQYAAAIDRRPLQLFARAGQSPPSA